MCKFNNGQISIHEFDQPIGMQLHEDKRWVKKVVTIPWPSRCGSVLGSCMIQAEYHFF